MMNINSDTLTYDHYIETDWIKPVDSLLIEFSYLLKKNLYLR
jgi:hypothetical protein